MVKEVRLSGDWGHQWDLPGYRENFSDEMEGLEDLKLRQSERGEPFSRGGKETEARAAGGSRTRQGNVRRDRNSVPPGGENWGTKKIKKPRQR